MGNTEEQVEIPQFILSDFMMETGELFGLEVYHWLSYLLIFVFLTYIYNNVFRTRKLPLFKAAIVYLLLAIGAFLLLIFQVDAHLPIVYSLLIAVALMLTVRIRYWLQERKK